MYAYIGIEDLVWASCGRYHGIGPRSAEMRQEDEQPGPRLLQFSLGAPETTETTVHLMISSLVSWFCIFYHFMMVTMITIIIYYDCMTTTVRFLLLVLLLLLLLLLQQALLL